MAGDFEYLLKARVSDVDAYWTVIRRDVTYPTTCKRIMERMLLWRRLKILR
ncbi:hypothetical protein PEC18_35345 [Paucibacter sp. O1-1]|nr:hypothetical protein [Paucibacter sp. O1-1]MDA3830944.1 hypothetical protein [Paucibacter sp. O1-1]